MPFAMLAFSQKLFKGSVPKPSCVVQSNISQNDDYILGFGLESFKKRIDRFKFAVNIACDVYHNAIKMY